MIPICPPRRGGPAPRVPGGYSLDESNFVVEELSLYEPSGEGEHVFALVEKIGMSTMFCVERLAAELGCSPRSIGYAGLKDRHARTVQWLSFGELSDAEALARLDVDGLRVLQVSRHGNKLKLGHLRGNRFTIGLECGADHVDGLRANLRDLSERGVPNFFGAQRFGSGGRNLEKGLRLLNADNPRRASRRFKKPLLRLILSSVQSEVFNRVLAARIDTADCLQEGDVAWLHHNGACFLVEDHRAERARCERFELSPTGPLPGPKCLRAAGAQAELEAGVLRELEIEHESFSAYRSNPGERRAFRTRLSEPSVEQVDGGARVSFALERGAFATTVLRELVEAPEWIEPDRQD